MTRLDCFALLAAASLLHVGCSASNPDEDLPELSVPDAGPEEEVVYLDVEAPVGTTPWPSVPVSGVGPKNGTLLIEGGRGETVVPLRSSGQFCQDVELVDGANEITFQAIDGEGVYSPVQVVNVIKQGTPPDPEPIETGQIQLGDRTEGAVFYDARGHWSWNELELEVGSWNQIVDANEAELVKFSGPSVLQGEIVAFSLSERVSAHAFELTVGEQEGETCGPAGYEIWVSDDPEPELSLDGYTWNMVARRTGPDISTSATTYLDQSTLPGIYTKHVAIKFTDSSCASFWSSKSSYGIAELRVIAEKEGQGSGPQEALMPSCVSGGL